jgi:predicted SnoaL-like aldol condensation-catalyzing enzyme
MPDTDSTARNKDIAHRALTGVFVDRDPRVVDQLLSPDCRQHNPHIPNGRDALRALIPWLGPDFRYEPGMIVAEGDYVMIHGRYTGLGDKPKIAVDIFRVVDGKVVEHWDVLQEELPAESTTSGNSMFTNPQAG